MNTGHVKPQFRELLLVTDELALTADLFGAKVYDLPPTSTLDIYWRAVGARIRRRARYRIKRVFDLVFGTLLLVLLAPLMVLIAVVIKLTSRGPVLYRQQRLMKDWHEFTLLKFRTMVDGADQMLDKVASLNEASGPLFKAKKDPRITWPGRILRCTFLDELPQLINVLRGEMSLVGPRPCLASEVSQMQQEMYFRFAVPQGITGPWQTNGYHKLPFSDQLQIERAYVQTWSLARDFLILVQTVTVVARLAGR
jgi:lipopolysaccharide/colanic/teichoic acid biosynthesis glycosyltransferase